MKTDRELLRETFNAMHTLHIQVPWLAPLVDEIRAYLNETESSDEPVAWLTEDGSIFRSHEIAAIGQANGPYPLYRHPRPARKLTDEEIFEVVREASRGSALMRDGSTSLRIARTIERRINGEEE